MCISSVLAACERAEARERGWTRGLRGCALVISQILMY